MVDKVNFLGNASKRECCKIYTHDLSAHQKPSNILNDGQTRGQYFFDKFLSFDNMSHNSRRLF